MVHPFPSSRSEKRSRKPIVVSRKASCFSWRARFFVVRATVFPCARPHCLVRSRIRGMRQRPHSSDGRERLSSKGHERVDPRKRGVLRCRATRLAEFPTVRQIKDTDAAFSRQLSRQILRHWVRCGAGGEPDHDSGHHKFAGMKFFSEQSWAYGCRRESVGGDRPADRPSRFDGGSA
jgi:hypothetical protein